MGQNDGDPRPAQGSVNNGGLGMFDDTLFGFNASGYDWYQPNAMHPWSFAIVQDLRVLRKHSTRSHTSTIACGLYNRAICHWDTDWNSRRPHFYLYCYLEPPIKDTKTFFLRYLSCPKHRLLIPGCYNSHHTKEWTETSIVTRSHEHGEWKAKIVCGNFVSH